MRSRFFLFLLLITCTNVFAQQGKLISIIFKPTFEGVPVIFDEMYTLPNGDSVSFDAFKFYVSNIKLSYLGTETYAERNSYHLVDAHKPNGNTVTIYGVEKGFNTLQFDLGIDSVTNVSGAKGGDLDPTKGMYWTWQSGYINAKIEGYSSGCKTRKHKFQLHIGGYKKGEYPLQHISLTTRDVSTMIVNIALDDFLGNIELSKHCEVMAPGKDAVGMAQQLASMFTLQP